MIELLTFVGFLVIQIIFGKTQNNYVYLTTMNSVISLMVMFVLFMRAFLKICMDKFWVAEKRFFLLSLFYFLLILDACLAVMFFGGDLIRPYGYWPIVRVISQIVMYGIGLVMFVTVKYLDFTQVKMLGKGYLIFNIIDVILVTTLLISDFLITPTLLGTDKFTILSINVLLLLLAITNICLVHFRTFWQHKETLLKMFDNLVKTHTEIKLIEPEMKNLRTNNIWQEIVIVLDQAPVRVLEMNLIVTQLHKIMIQNGRTAKDATNFIADFSSVIIKNLMKRKWDFDYLPAVLVNFKQKHSKLKKGWTNQRGAL